MNRPSVTIKRETLRYAIASRFGRIPVETDFNVNRQKLENLGYSNEDLDQLPREIIAAFSGVGNPLAIAPLKKGDTIVDVGCGSGLDVCLASRVVGKTGHVYGVDMTQEQIDLSRKGIAKLGLRRVTIVKGYVESIPLPNQMADVVISNGLMHLCPDQIAVFEECFRILKRGGRIQFAVVVKSDRRDEIPGSPSQWIDEFAGALKIHDYVSMLEEAGFDQVVVTKFGKLPVETDGRKRGTCHICAVKPPL